MDSHVYFQCPIGKERLATDLTLMRSFASVRANVIRQRIFVREGPLTNRTGESPILSGFDKRMFWPSAMLKFDVVILLLMIVLYIYISKY